MRWGIQSLKIAAIKLLMRALALAVLPLQVLGLEAVTFATDWKAQAEQGGFYQAKALGLYEKAGLDVTIRGGGPGLISRNYWAPLRLISAWAQTASFR